MKRLLCEENLTQEIEQAHRQAAQRWIGCDWPTEFGATRLNLNGLKSSQALLWARATSGSERAVWEAAATWLADIEQVAKDAEEKANVALALARVGKLREALAQARLACATEAKYHGQPVWLPLRQAIEAVLNADAS